MLLFISQKNLFQKNLSELFYSHDIKTANKLRQWWSVGVLKVAYNNFQNDVISRSGFPMVYLRRKGSYIILIRPFPLFLAVGLEPEKFDQRLHGAAVQRIKILLVGPTVQL